MLSLDMCQLFHLNIITKNNKMKKSDIIKIITNHFKPKDVGIGLLDCISEVQQIEDLATDLEKKIEISRQKDREIVIVGSHCHGKTTLAHAILESSKNMHGSLIADGEESFTMEENSIFTKPMMIHLKPYHVLDEFEIELNIPKKQTHKRNYKYHK